MLDQRLADAIHAAIDSDSWVKREPLASEFIATLETRGYTIVPLAVPADELAAELDLNPYDRDQPENIRGALWGDK